MATPIWGIKFKIQISQVFFTAFKNTPSANNRSKFFNPTKSAFLLIKVVLVKLRANVLYTGYTPKIRKPIINGAIKRYP
jgi:hypothetical protein